MDVKIAGKVNFILISETNSDFGVSIWGIHADRSEKGFYIGGKDTYGLVGRSGTNDKSIDLKFVFISTFLILQVVLHHLGKASLGW